MYEVAGKKRLTARFEFVADRQYDVELSAPMRLGLEAVELDATLSLEPDPETGGLDAVVTQMITNTGGGIASAACVREHGGVPASGAAYPGYRAGADGDPAVSIPGRWAGGHADEDPRGGAGDDRAGCA